MPLALLAMFANGQSLSLDQAVASARDKRASVQAARLRLERARFCRRALGTLPATSLLVGYSNDLRVGGSDDDLVISQPIDLFGRTNAARRTGDALVLQAEANLRQIELELQNDVVTLYVDAVATRSRVLIAKEAESGAQSLYLAIRELVEGGKLPGVQATRVSIELLRATAARKQREVEAAAALRRLAAAIATEKVSVAQAFPAIPTLEVSEALLKSHRADLMLLSAEVAEANADARLARADRQPQLELQGRRSAWQEDPAYGVRLQLNFPLFDGGKSRAQEAAARRHADAARKSFEDALSIARAETEAARLEVRGAQAQIGSLDQVIATARDLVSRTEIGLKEGANTLVDVLDASRALREIQESLIDARATLSLSQARYLRATGTLLEVRP